MLLTFVDLGDGQPANGCLDDRRHVAGIQPIAPGGGTQGRDANRRLAERAKNSQVRHPPDVLHGGNDLASLVFVHPQIRSHHLDRVLALDARHGLFHVVGNDLREIEHHAGKGASQVALHVVGERRLGYARAPFGGGTQGCQKLDVVEAGHVGTVVGPPELRDDTLDLGPGSLGKGTVTRVFARAAKHNGADVAHVARRPFKRDRGGQGGTDPEITLFQLGHEFAAEQTGRSQCQHHGTHA